jgi:hypothetical protein
MALPDSQAGGPRRGITVGELRDWLAQFEPDDTVHLDDPAPASDAGSPDRLAQVEQRLGALEWDFAQWRRDLERDRRQRALDLDDDAA